MADAPDSKESGDASSPGAAARKLAVPESFICSVCEEELDDDPVCDVLGFSYHRACIEDVLLCVIVDMYICMHDVFMYCMSVCLYVCVL